MRIESVEFFYLSMPVVTTEADGSQDALLVRVRGGGFTGHGECEAAPLPGRDSRSWSPGAEPERSSARAPTLPAAV